LKKLIKKKNKINLMKLQFKIVWNYSKNHKY
jgi:hypothetical protein